MSIYLNGDSEKAAGLEKLNDESYSQYNIYVVSGKLGYFENMSTIIQATVASNKEPEKTILLYDERSFESNHTVNDLRQVAEILKQNGSHVYGNIEELQKFITSNLVPQKSPQAAKEDENKKSDFSRVLFQKTDNVFYQDEDCIKAIEGYAKEYNGVHVNFCNANGLNSLTFKEIEEQKKECGCILYVFGHRGSLEEPVDKKYEVEKFSDIAQVINDSFNKDLNVIYYKPRMIRLNEGEKKLYQDVEGIIKKNGARIYYDLRLASYGIACIIEKELEKQKSLGETKEKNRGFLQIIKGVLPQLQNKEKTLD